jgi:iron complex outermembrane recepter protein
MDSGKKTDLTMMNIEDLMNIKVTSVSKTEQKLSRTASAVFAIEREDIRHSGALNLPDLLRMVPGLDVAQITSNTWAIGARGLNGRFSNKLLVMVDGRRVYSLTTGGVFWDVSTVPLEDIERIEVIRGPGGSVWGANAVEGVINIITKNADDTHGVLMTAGGGNVDQGFGLVQYGGDLHKKVDYRIYTKYLNRDHMPSGAGQGGGDEWHLLQGGFRADSPLSAKDTLMVQGNVYTGEEGMPLTFLPSIASSPRFNDSMAGLSGGFIQLVWNHSFSARADTSFEVSYDNYQRNDFLREGRNTLNLDFQHHILWGERQNILWGLAFRHTSSKSDGNLAVSLTPPDATYQLFSSFAQDEIALIPNRLYLTVGMKLERNYYTGWAAMPSVRVAWQVDDQHTIWGAFSRPVRTPNENDTALRTNFTSAPGPGGTLQVFGIVGNPNFQNEKIDAYELGYRTTLSNEVSLDFVVFYDGYDDLQSIEPGAPFLESDPAPVHLVIPVTYQNHLRGEAHGLEISTNWKVLPKWTISPGYAFEGIHMHLDPASQDTTSVGVAEGSSPRHSAQLRSRVDLPHGLEWNTTAYFVDRLASGNVPSYTRLDTQLSWKWAERGTVSLVGQNLLQDHHFEFQDPTQSIMANQVKRSGYVQVSWRY